MPLSDATIKRAGLTSLRLVYRRELPCRPLNVWEWHRRAHAVDRLLPYSRLIEVLRRPVHLCTGAVLLLRMKLPFFPKDLRFETESHEVGRYFCERMTRGPFARWRHQHYFIPWKDKITLLEDRLELIASQYEWINQWLHPWIEHKLDALFNWRHFITAFDLRLWNQLPFARRVHVVSMHPAYRALTSNLRCALEPIPPTDTDPCQMTNIHEGCTVVLNALGHHRGQLPPVILSALARFHAHTLICFGNMSSPPWLATLQAYGDRIVYIHVGLLLRPWMKIALKMGWRPQTWCCEEDILSAIFQITHDRLTSNRYSLGVSEKSPYPDWLTDILRTVHEKLAIQEKRDFHPPLLLRERAFKDVDEWLRIYEKL